MPFTRANFLFKASRPNFRSSQPRAIDRSPLIAQIIARLSTEMSDVVLHKAEMEETQEQKEERIELAHNQQVGLSGLRFQMP